MWPMPLTLVVVSSCDDHSLQSDDYFIPKLKQNTAEAPILILVHVRPI